MTTMTKMITMVMVIIPCGPHIVYLVYIYLTLCKLEVSYHIYIIYIYTYIHPCSHINHMYTNIIYICISYMYIIMYIHIYIYLCISLLYMYCIYLCLRTENRSRKTHVFEYRDCGVEWGGVGGHVNVPCTSYMIYCHAAEISGIVYYVTCCYAADGVGWGGGAC